MRAGWRVLPAELDDTALAGPVAAARARRPRPQARIPDSIRHREKWRLALESTDEMTGRRLGVLEQVAAAAAPGQR